MKSKVENDVFESRIDSDWFSPTPRLVVFFIKQDKLARLPPFERCDEEGEPNAARGPCNGDSDWNHPNWTQQELPSHAPCHQQPMRAVAEV